MFVKWYWFALAGIFGLFVLLWLVAGRDKATMAARVSLNTPINRASTAVYGAGMFDLLPPSHPLRFDEEDEDGDQDGGDRAETEPCPSESETGAEAGTVDGGDRTRERGERRERRGRGGKSETRERGDVRDVGREVPAGQAAAHGGDRDTSTTVRSRRAAGGGDNNINKSRAAAPQGGRAPGTEDATPRQSGGSIEADAVRGIARKYGLAVTSAIASPRLPLREGAHLPDSIDGVRRAGADLTPRLPPSLPAPSALSLARARQEGGGSKASEKYFQGLTQKAAERVFGVKFEVDRRPEWLVSPITGRCLELDLLNTDIGVAIEYNGYQHYVYPNKWHPATDEGIAKFLRGVRNDEIKRNICDEVGVYLIVVPYSAHDFDERAEGQIEEFIRKFHPDEELKRQQAAARGMSATSRTDVVVTSHNLLDDEDLEVVDEEDDE